MTSVWISCRRLRIRSHWKTCSKPRSIGTATMCRGPTTTGCRRNPWCATWWKPPPTSPDTSPDTTSPAPKAPCCATSRTPTARWRAPCRPKSVTSNSKTSSRGCACSCAPSTPRWWTNGRTPVTRLTNPRLRHPGRARRKKRGGRGPSWSYRAGAQCLVPPCAAYGP